jgi:hypothetical protein
MKNLTLTMLFTFLVVISFILPVQAEMATIYDARNVADNWVSLVLHYDGGWGESETAEIEHIQEFKRGKRTLGYYCPVKPRGFIIVSLLKGLSPIKAYSETSILDPESDEGPADLLKLKMEQMLNGIEKLAGSVSTVGTQDLESILEINHLSKWDALDVDPEEFKPKLESIGFEDVYQPGTFLLSSSWHQGDPYNRQCPAGHNGCTEPHCAVGCVATAGAMIMHHWCWPPSTFDWPNIPNAIDGSSPQAQIDAVSHLCLYVGLFAAMDYCMDEDSPCLSGTPTSNMEGVFEYVGYSLDCCWVRREGHSTEQWWAGPGMIRDQISVNRPVQYQIKNHSIVCDGWKAGYMVHMNYGWANHFTTWYSIDGLWQPELGGGGWYGIYAEELAVFNISPNVSLISPVYGSFPSIPDWPYRYFDRDCTGGPADFAAGQLIQLLHNVTVNATEGDFLFHGIPNYESRLFTRGDTTQGVRIKNGTLKLMPGGSIKLIR